eukprot:Rmarinus@m.12805
MRFLRWLFLVWGIIGVIDCLHLPKPIRSKPRPTICSACETVVYEIENVIRLKMEDKDDMIRIGSHRLDPNGNRPHLQTRLYAGSELHVLEILENKLFCESIVKNTHGTTVLDMYMYIHKNESGLLHNEETGESMPHGVTADFVTGLDGEEAHPDQLSSDQRDDFLNICRYIVTNFDDSLLESFTERRKKVPDHTATLPWIRDSFCIDRTNICKIDEMEEPTQPKKQKTKKRKQPSKEEL